MGVPPLPPPPVPVQNGATDRPPLPPPTMPPPPNQPHCNLMYAPQKVRPKPKQQPGAASSLQPDDVAPPSPKAVASAEATRRRRPKPTMAPKLLAELQQLHSDVEAAPPSIARRVPTWWMLWKLRSERRADRRPGCNTTCQARFGRGPVVRLFELSLHSLQP